VPGPQPGYCRPRNFQKHRESAVARGGGANGATVPAIQGRGHPKSEITKIKMLYLINFPIARLLTHSPWI